MGKVATVTVAADNDAGHLVINQSDYNPEIHGEILESSSPIAETPNEETPAAEEPEAQTEAVEETEEPEADSEELNEADGTDESADVDAFDESD